MAKPVAHFIRPAFFMLAVLATLGCGVTSAPAAATATARPTATPLPTATPPPGHLVVTVHPIDCGSSSCTPYVCNAGTTCTAGGICTASAWPTFTLSNSGGGAVTWHASFDGHGSATIGWTVSAATGSLAGGGSTTVTVNDNPGTIQTTNPSVVFAAPGQTVTIDLHCGIG